MTKFFTVEQVIEIHDAFLEDHGGLPGIRDKGLLIFFLKHGKEKID